MIYRHRNTEYFGSSNSIKKLKNWRKKQRKSAKKKKKQWKYAEYIVSPEWKRRRKLYFLSHKKQCTVCETTKGRIVLHHMRYNHVGNEPDEDLVALCWDCHEEFHNLYGTKDLWNNSQIFIMEEQQRRELEDLVKIL